MERKRNPGVGLGKHSVKHTYSNSATAQRERILKIFDTSPSLSTLQARNEYGILHPGGRIMELRQKGHRIETYWVLEPDANGVLHRVGLYVYQGHKLGGHHAR